MKTNTKNSKNAGFTLIELLISAGLLGAILLFSSQYFAQTNQLSRIITSQATLQEELRNAGNIITDEIQRAVYVFTPCGIYSSATQPIPTLKPGCTGFATTPTTATLSLLNVSWSSFTLAASGERTKRPDNGTYVWEVGATPDAPILAMIVAPYRPNQPCEASSTTTNDGGCYQFVAYYPVKRQQITRGFSTNSATAGDLLDKNDSESQQWVIMEYRKRLTENLDYTSSLFTSFGIPGVGTMAAGVLTTGLILGPVPRINWRSVGCTGTCVIPAPDPDPNPSNQQTGNSLPTVAKGTTKAADLVQFSARMAATVRWINSAPRGDSSLLVENIRPVTGFAIEFTNNGMDERGATEVRLRLQGELNRGGDPVRFPAQPLEFFATPRNIAP
jgi:prepilin-type N-terminal cleavage/methylation domain-containing protein